MIQIVKTSCVVKKPAIKKTKLLSRNKTKSYYTNITTHHPKDFFSKINKKFALAFINVNALKLLKTETNTAIKHKNKKKGGEEDAAGGHDSNLCNLPVTCEAQSHSAPSYLLCTHSGEAAAGQLSAAASGSGKDCSSGGGRREDCHCIQFLPFFFAPSHYLEFCS